MSELPSRSNRKPYRLDNDQDLEEVLKLLAEGSDVDGFSDSEDDIDEIEAALPQISQEALEESDSEREEEVEVEENENVSQEQESQSEHRRRMLWKVAEFETAQRTNSVPVMPTNPPLLPIRYFERYFDKEHFEKAAKFTEMYALSKTGRAIKTDASEIRRLYGIHMYFGCIPLPRLYMYWKRDFQHNVVTSAMSRTRFFQLRKCLHYVDTSIESTEVATNALWKVQPVIDAVRNRCLSIPRYTQNYSIDEQMIPFLGRCPNRLRQYVRNKPRPVGLKNFVLSSSTGMVLDFEVYQGAITPLGDRSLGLGPSVILRLTRTLPEYSFVFFDRYFSTIPLFDRLKDRKIYGTGTIMTNRLKNVELKNDRAMSRGEADQRVRADGRVAVVKWKDNKTVTMASTAFGKDPMQSVSRWSKEERGRINLPCPSVIKEYNAHMGGVDVCDQLMECYRTWIKTRKWTLKVALHFVDLALVNSWFEYRTDCQLNNIPKNKVLDLLHFKLDIAEALLSSSKRKRPETDDDEEPEEAQTSSKKTFSPLPGSSKRLDGLNHWPVVDHLKSARMCRYKKCSSRTRSRCEKCNVYLCIAQEKSCFKLFHTDE